MSYSNPSEEHRSTGKAGEAQKTRGVGRPPDASRDTRILEAAWTLFLGAGVEATSMEAVAAKAHVSKSTLYATFPDRAALFEAAILHEMVRIEASQQINDDTINAAPLRQRLQTFGVGIMSFLASDVGVAYYGLLSAEIRRRPDLSEAFWRLGPGRTRANLTAMLGHAVAQGEIAPIDPAHAADLLFGLWQGFSNLELAVAGGAERVRATVIERVTRGTEMFLALHTERRV